MPLRVLVADDSAVVRVALARRLRLAGLDVALAATTAEAKAVDATALDLAVLDFDLGDGWGDEIAAALRAVRPDLPIAFFTSSPPTETEARLRPYGPTFAKPEAMDEVVAWALRAAKDDA
ncbi:MAG: response regulator [Labilithrix sp.]|nr:response regulator [Labilithrix sp.]MCW5813710.1 response regulator [Labilithrix sp.]